MASPAEQAEEMMYNDIEQVCAQVQHQEKEWDPETFNKKMAQYLRKAGKATPGSGQWQLIVERFTNKFYELLSSACYDRAWLDTADFALPIASAIKAYVAQPGTLEMVAPDEYLQHVAQCCTLAHDLARYYSNAWETMKQVVPNKVAQKKVREAIDSARETVVKQMPGNFEAFVTSWVQQGIELLAQASYKSNPKASLTEADATRLFDALIQEGGGLPLWLEALNGGKPMPGCPEIANAVAMVYSAHPELPPKAPKGMGKDPWGMAAGAYGGGYGAWGGAPAFGGGYGGAYGGGYDPWGGKGGKPY